MCSVCFRRVFSDALVLATALRTLPSHWGFIMSIIILYTGNNPYRGTFPRGPFIGIIAQDYLHQESYSNNLLYWKYSPGVLKNKASLGYTPSVHFFNKGPSKWPQATNCWLEIDHCLETNYCFFFITNCIATS